MLVTGRRAVTGASRGVLSLVNFSVAAACPKMTSVFSEAEAIPPADILRIRQAFAKDPSPNKVDLGVGAYRTEEGKPWILPVVQKTEIELTKNGPTDHEYLMYLGIDSFRQSCVRLLLGEKNVAALGNKAFGVQSLGGTGAVRLGAELLARVLKFNTVYTPTPTWDNHHRICLLSGFTDLREYRYWDLASRGLNIDGLIEDLKQATPGSVVILHACAHNPTGCDPTREQWVRIADVMKERKLFPFFDSAYQGFASGDLEADAWSVRHFVEQGFELLCAQSFSKNAGLYNERIGNLTVVLNDTSAIPRIETHLMTLVRGSYGNPNNFGMKIVDRIINDDELCKEWKENIKTMANRVLAIRKSLREHLERLKTPGNWEHITQQIGMFSYTGLTPRQVDFLSEEKHIYMLRSGRANMCGINSKNIGFVSQAIHDAVTQFPG